jgi:twitching motility protein PilT
LGNPAVHNIIRENKTQQLYNVISTGQSVGMVSMDVCLKNLYHQGIITYDTAVTHARNPQEMRSLDDQTAVVPNGTGTL